MYFLLLYFVMLFGFWNYQEYSYAPCKKARNAYIKQIDICLAQKQVTMDCVEKVVELGKEETKVCK